MTVKTINKMLPNLPLIRELLTSVLAEDFLYIDGLKIFCFKKFTCLEFRGFGGSWYNLNRFLLLTLIFKSLS